MPAGAPHVPVVLFLTQPPCREQSCPVKSPLPCAIMPSEITPALCNHAQ